MIRVFTKSHTVGRKGANKKYIHYEIKYFKIAK